MILKLKFYLHKTPIFFKYANIDKVLLSKKISSGGKKTTNTLLVTCIMIIKVMG